MAEPSPFEDDLLSAVAGAPAASLAPASNTPTAAVDAVGGSQSAGQSAIVPPADDDVLGTGVANDQKADVKADAKDETPKGPTPYQVWEAKRAQVLAERQAKADEAKRALAVAAKEEIVKFNSLRAERIVSNKAQNRLDEKQTKAEIAALFQFGAQWEKVGRLINIAPKANEKRSVDRMRKLMLSLKNDAPSAAAAADGSKKGGDSKSK